MKNIVNPIWSRELQSEPSSVTVIKDCANRYFLSFVVKVGIGNCHDSKRAQRDCQTTSVAELDEASRITAAELTVSISTAFYSSEMQEFILPYEAVRQADDPDALVLTFFQSTYEAAANLADWDRVALERS
jgi:hypothetical protein